MTIKLYENQEGRRLTIDFTEKAVSVSAQMQKGVMYRYADDLSLVRIEVTEPTLIDPILTELRTILDNPSIQIIRKVA